jgi:hypothetical protein
MSNRRSPNSPILRNKADKLRKRQRESLRGRAQRNLRIEPLEARRLLAVSPELLEIEAGGQLIDDGDIRHESFGELLFRFDTDDAIDPGTLDGFQLSRPGENGMFGDADDLIVSPAFAGIGDSPNEVILRFAETLPDDAYGIHVDSSVSGTNGEAANNGNDVDIFFTMDQGTQVISVVPQPILRDPDTGELSQAKDQVVVHFNSNQLDAVVAANPSYYRLTDELTGELLFPEEVQYSTETSRAILTLLGGLAR